MPAHTDAVCGCSRVQSILKAICSETLIQELITLGKMHKGVNVEQSYLRQFGLTAVLRVQIKYWTREFGFQPTTALGQSSTKSRELLYVFEHPPNVARYLAASLKGNVLLFVSLH